MSTRQIFNKMWVIALLASRLCGRTCSKCERITPDTTAPTVSAANPDFFRQTICGDSDTASPTVSFTGAATSARVWRMKIDSFFLKNGIPRRTL